MQISHIVDPTYLDIAAKYSSVLYANPNGDPKHFEPFNLPVVLDTAGLDIGASVTAIAKLAKAFKAQEVILTPPFILRTSAEKVLGWFEKCITSSALQGQRLVLNPCVNTSVGAGAYWDIIFQLYQKGLSTRPEIAAMALDSVEVVAMSGIPDLTPFDAYHVRPSMVNRMSSQLSSKHLPIDLIGLSNRGGRELVEYRFVRAVRRCYTLAAWDITGSNVQLGIPTKGAVRCMSSTDFEISELGLRIPGDQIDKSLLDSNMQILTGLAGT